MGDHHSLARIAQPVQRISHQAGVLINGLATRVLMLAAVSGAISAQGSLHAATLAPAQAADVVVNGIAIQPAGSASIAGLHGSVDGTQGQLASSAPLRTLSCPVAQHEAEPSAGQGAKRTENGADQLQPIGPGEAGEKISDEHAMYLLLAEVFGIVGVLLGFALGATLATRVREVQHG